MNKSATTIIGFFGILILSSCGELPETAPEFLKRLTPVKKTIIEKKELSISCDNGNIDLFTKKGWVIKSASKEEVTCSWKTIKSRRGCNLEKDKGCKLTVPDKKGTLIKYTLERKKQIN